MKTSPAASTAAPSGFNNVVPTVLCAPAAKATCGPMPCPETKVVTSTLPAESSNCTAPIRTPGAWGANDTVTVQVLPGVCASVQLDPLMVKSRRLLPCVTTLGVG